MGLWWPLGWWALNYCPGDLVGKLLALRPVKAVAKVGRRCTIYMLHRVRAIRKGSSQWRLQWQHFQTLFCLRRAAAKDLGPAWLMVKVGVKVAKMGRVVD